MGQRDEGMDMSPIRHCRDKELRQSIIHPRCHNKKVIAGLEWYCNLDKGHGEDHMYLVKNKNASIGYMIAMRWKQ